MSDTESESAPKGDLREVLPESLHPLYERWLLVEEFRATHGSTYIGVLEAIVALVLIGGYVYWLYLFLVAG